MKRALSLTVLLCATACGGGIKGKSDAGAGSGGSSGGSGGSGSETFTGTGTFTATSAAGPVNATLAPIIEIGGSPNFLGSFAFSINIGTATGRDGLTFSSPSGITSNLLGLSVGFPGTAPTTGTFTQDSTGYCGTIGLTYSNDAQTINENFTAGADACPPSNPGNTGSWSLTLSSLTLGPTNSDTGVTYYTAHGSFSASMVDGASGTGTLSVTF